MRSFWPLVNRTPFLAPSLHTSSGNFKTSSKMSFSTAVGALLSYAAASALFWNYPQLLHKKKKIAFTASHISHRGGSAEGYENTIRAFKCALENGTDMLELDVRLTKDGQVVVFHDADLLRMTGRNVRIADIEYDNLPLLNKRVPIDTIPGKFFDDASWSDTDRKIPLLRHVLSHFPNVPMNIDLKDDDDNLIEAVSNLLEEYHRRDITVWGSFNNRVCQKCHELDPNSLVFFSVKKVVLIVCLAAFGILPFIPIKETHFEVFLPLALKRRRLQQNGATGLSTTEKIVLWLCETFVTARPLISHLKKRGIHVYLWVCNNEDEFSLCKAIGATGIMTDEPSRLRKFLDTHDDNDNSVGMGKL